MSRHVGNYLTNAPKIWCILKILFVFTFLQNFLKKNNILDIYFIIIYKNLYFIIKYFFILSFEFFFGSI
jgi:hypothetical protein